MRAKMSMRHGHRLFYRMLDEKGLHAQGLVKGGQTREERGESNSPWSYGLLEAIFRSGAQSEVARAQSLLPAFLSCLTTSQTL